MTGSEKSLLRIALDELESTTCVCGNRKQSRQSFCKPCYFALPPNVRRDLYKTISDGYAEIYDRAKEYLRVETDRLNV